MCGRSLCTEYTWSQSGIQKHNPPTKMDWNRLSCVLYDLFLPTYRDNVKLVIHYHSADWLHIIPYIMHGKPYQKWSAFWRRLIYSLISFFFFSSISFQTSISDSLCITAVAFPCRILSSYKKTASLSSPFEVKFSLPSPPIATGIDHD